MRLIDSRVYKVYWRLILFLSLIVLSMYYFDGAYDYLQNLNRCWHSLSFLLLSDTVLKLWVYQWNQYMTQKSRKMQLTFSSLALLDLLFDSTYGWYHVYLVSSRESDLFLLLRLFHVLRDLRMILII